jgi:hypothetical protein
MALPLEDEGRAYVIGRGEHCDLLLDEPDASREHALIVRRGSIVLVKDLSSKNGVWLGETRIEPGRDVVWRPALMLRTGHTVLALDEPVARALADLEAMADEPLAPEDVPEPPPPSNASKPSPTGAPAASDAGARVGPGAPIMAMPAAKDSRAATTVATRGRTKSAWSATDAAVVALAVLVLAASIVGLVLLLRA